MKYNSITTSGIQHDEANILTELVFLNKDLNTAEYIWKTTPKWGKLVRVFKKLMKKPFELSSDQLAFYVYRCSPRDVDSKEFAKMAVVARKLLQKFNLFQLVETYRTRRAQLSSGYLDKVTYKEMTKTKSLVDLLKEIENDQRK